MLSVNQSFFEVCYDTSHFTPKCSLLTPDFFANLATIRSSNMQKLSGGQRQERPNLRYTFRSNRFCSRRRGGSSSSDRDSRVSQTEKSVLLCLLRKTRAGSLNEYPHYIDLSGKRATGNTGSVRCTIYQRTRTSGTTSKAAQDSFTMIVSLFDHRNRGEQYEETPQVRSPSSYTTRLLFNSKQHPADLKADAKLTNIVRNNNDRGACWDVHPRYRSIRDSSPFLHHFKWIAKSNELGQDCNTAHTNRAATTVRQTRFTTPLTWGHTYSNPVCNRT